MFQLSVPISFCGEIFFSVMSKKEYSSYAEYRAGSFESFAYNNFNYLGYFYGFHKYFKELNEYDFHESKNIIKKKILNEASK